MEFIRSLFDVHLCASLYRWHEDGVPCGSKSRGASEVVEEKEVAVTYFPTQRRAIADRITITSFPVLTLRTVFVLDMASRQLPYEVTRESLLGLRASLTELPANAAAAEEWVKSFSDVLARCVPALI